jgi:hypothetical protein
MGESSWGKQPLNGTLAKFRYGNADAALASVLTTNKERGVCGPHSLHIWG